MVIGFNNFFIFSALEKGFYRTLIVCASINADFIG